MKTEDTGRISWKGLASAIYAGVVALLVVNALPALVAAIAKGLGWDDRVLGMFASADVAGITIGSILGVPVVRRWRLRSITAFSISILVLADILCGLTTSQWFMVTFRVLGGVASGLILSACYAVYSESHPQRNFALFSIGQMTSSFLTVTLIPLLVAHMGWRSAFGLLVIMSGISLPLVVYIPSHRYDKGFSEVTPQISTSHTHRRASDAAVWAAVGGLVAYIIGEGAVWTFMGRMGLASGLPESTVNFAVSACALAGVFGAVSMLFPSKWMGGEFGPLVSMAILSVAAVSLMRSANTAIYVFALCGYAFSWLSFSTVQFAVIADADKRGTATIAMSAAWYGGFTIGPYLAGALAKAHGYVPVQILGIGGVVLALITLIPLRKRAPQVVPIPLV